MLRAEGVAALPNQATARCFADAGRFHNPLIGTISRKLIANYEPRACSGSRANGSTTHRSPSITQGGEWTELPLVVGVKSMDGCASAAAERYDT